MAVIMNIPAKMVMDEAFLPGVDRRPEEVESGRLVLDELGGSGRIMFGKPGLFSTEVEVGANVFFLHHLGPDDQVRVWETGRLSKTSYFSIMVWYGDTDDSVPHASSYFFICGKEDAARLASECERIISTVQRDHCEQEEARKDLQDELDKLIIDRCKTTGRMNMTQFAEDNLASIRMILEMQDVSRAEATDYVAKRVQQFVTDDVLPGLLNEDALQYTDRDLLVREQRVVHVQMDYNQLLEQLGNKGVVLSSITCPQCGAGCSVPESGTTFDCEFCGTTVRVVDILESFKGILG